MAERVYSLKDVNEFLNEHYGLDWKDYEIIQGLQAVAVSSRDFRKTSLWVVAVLYRDGEQEFHWMAVSNRYFSVYGELNRGKARLWKNFLAKRYNQVKSL